MIFNNHTFSATCKHSSNKPLRNITHLEHKGVGSLKFINLGATQVNYQRLAVLPKYLP